jgi:1,4-dihydroxy-2-naphthoate octaprenyltransferase
MKVTNFLRQARGMFLTCTVVPVFLGAALAYYETGTFNGLLFALTLLGVSLAHLGVNLSNDYFDFASGADTVHTEQRPYSGGGDALTRDKVSPGKIKVWFWACFCAALAIGIVILALVEKGHGLILAIMILGFFGGYFYTAPPFRFAYRGLGELDVFFFMGPAPVLGTYAVLTGTLSLGAFIGSLPVAALIAGLLWINEYTDFETDKLSDKRNLVVRLGKKQARWGFLGLVVFVYAAVVIPVAMGILPTTFLLALLTVPLAFRSVKRAMRYFEHSEKIMLAQADFLKVHLMTGLLCAIGVVAGAFI